MKNIKKILTINIGDQHGDYTCIDIIHKKHNNFYVMKCNICGRTKEMLTSTIRMKHGITHKSCGKGLKTKDPIFYNRWQAMRTRTTNQNHAHANCYVNRNINSDEFQYFIDFYDAMYKSYLELANKIGKENTSLERIDVNGNYTKENCTWIPKTKQQGNTRRNATFKATYPDGHEENYKNLRKFAKENNLDYGSLSDILNNRRTTPHKGFIVTRIKN